jgi:hypothetical protein
MANDLVDDPRAGGHSPSIARSVETDRYRMMSAVYDGELELCPGAAACVDGFAASCAAGYDLERV